MYPRNKATNSRGSKDTEGPRLGESNVSQSLLSLHLFSPLSALHSRLDPLTLGMSDLPVSSSASSSDSTAYSVTQPMEVVAPMLPQAERVDKFLMSHTKLSRSALQRLFEHDRILVNGIVCKKNYKVCIRSELASS